MELDDEINSLKASTAAVEASETYEFIIQQRLNNNVTMVLVQVTFMSPDITETIGDKFVSAASTSSPLCFE